MHFHHLLTLLDYTEAFVFKSFKYVVPYYVLKTPENGWEQSDIGLFFAMHSFGSFIGTQTVVLSDYFTSNRILYYGTLLQFISAFFGFLIITDINDHNTTLFAVAMFLIGMSFSDGSHQMFIKLYAMGDSELEQEMMIHLGVNHYIAILITSLAAPLIYQYMSFHAYAISGFICCSIHIVCLSLVIFGMTQRIKKESNPSISASRKSIGNVDERHRSEEQTTEISLFKWMSPSLVVLIISVAVWALTYMMYNLSYYVVFAKTFHISATAAGATDAVATVIAIAMTKLNHIGQSKSLLWQYPYDITAFYIQFAFGCFFFYLFFEKYVVYTFHIVALSASITISTAELIARLYLVPRGAFKKITALNSILTTISFFVASMVTPILLKYDKHLPFLLCAIMASCMVLLIFVTFMFRKRFLDNVFNVAEDTQLSYLAQEMAYYHSMRVVHRRRTPVLNAEEVNRASTNIWDFSCKQSQVIRASAAMALNKSSLMFMSANANAMDYLQMIVSSEEIQKRHTVKVLELENIEDLELNTDSVEENEADQSEIFELSLVKPAPK